MPRSITVTINGAKLLETPQTTWDLATMTGQASAYYVPVFASTNANGETTFSSYAGVTGGASASVQLTATDTGPSALAKLVGQIAAQEGLTLPASGGDDHVYDQSGTLLA